MAGEWTGGPRGGAPPQTWPSGNRVLDLLPEADAALLTPLLEPLTLQSGHIVGQTGEAMTCAFFPCAGTVFSLVVDCDEGRAAEAVSIGQEGQLGPELIGLPGLGHVLVQMPGRALRIQADALAHVAADSAPLRDALEMQRKALMVRLVQAAVCSALHPVEARASFWLLLAQDRREQPDLPVTQELLAAMLGVRRTTVTRVMAQLTDRGLIRHRRSRVTVIDRPGLEAVACGCHKSLLTRLRRVAPALYPD
ncbi:Crp/Fnr family transcriptional regulator [Paracraurococcus lichenis]|uniref:Crp/Fnr family transcriptional regulator n=1 Tax=Paracraurococcus lichenis TaxID=3064888 RepID=A0ABT9E4R9_9PROT|nr:Crp/Fnr family transcriptional regulator [Paracraurococcus sp. LOR1-02]MDO9711102.1 Crp/Fnr family transcriptional regulator [Paracraurococcus sp. LOR1-02]